MYHFGVSDVSLRQVSPIQRSFYRDEREYILLIRPLPGLNDPLIAERSLGLRSTNDFCDLLPDCTPRNCIVQLFYIVIFFLKFF